MSTTRDIILAADDIDSEVIEVPEWGVKMAIRGMDGTTRAAMVKKFMSNDAESDIDNLYPSLLIACCFDAETGEQLFTEEHKTAINQKNGVVVERIAMACMRIAGLSKDSVEEGKDDSTETTPSDSSTSSSPNDLG